MLLPPFHPLQGRWWNALRSLHVIGVTVCCIGMSVLILCLSQEDLLLKPDAFVFEQHHQRFHAADNHPVYRAMYHPSIETTLSFPTLCRQFVVDIEVVNITEAATSLFHHIPASLPHKRNNVESQHPPVRPNRVIDVSHLGVVHAFEGIVINGTTNGTDTNPHDKDSQRSSAGLTSVYYGFIVVMILTIISVTMCYYLFMGTLAYLYPNHIADMLINREKEPYKWLFFAITASCHLLVLAILIGIENVIFLFAVFVCLMIGILLGYYIESETDSLKLGCLFVVAASMIVTTFGLVMYHFAINYDIYSIALKINVINSFVGFLSFGVISFSHRFLGFNFVSIQTVYTLMSVETKSVFLVCVMVILFS